MPRHVINHIDYMIIGMYGYSQALFAYVTGKEGVESSPELMKSLQVCRLLRYLTFDMSPLYVI
jgi:hypothetical protein